jgi:hypothetical protein
VEAHKSISTRPVLSVLVEAYDLIAKCEAFEQKLQGGVKEYMRVCRESNLVSLSDGHIVRTGFLHPTDMGLHSLYLESLGFTAEDMVLVDEAERHGFMQPCDWLGYYRHPDAYSMCWLKGTDPSDFHAPITWSPENKHRCNLTNGKRFVVLKEADETGTIAVDMHHPAMWGVTVGRRPRYTVTN